MKRADWLCVTAWVGAIFTWRPVLTFTIAVDPGGEIRRYGIYMSVTLSPHHMMARDRKPISPPGGAILYVRRDMVARRNPMLDIAFLVIGALFLGGCAVYALACEQL